MSHVSYVPLTRDYDSTTPQREEGFDRCSSLRSLSQDLVVLYQNLPYVLDTITPRRLARPLPGVEYHHLLLYRDYCFMSAIALVELLLPMTLLVAVLFYRSLTSLGSVFLAACMIWVLARIMQGERVVTSKSPSDVQRVENESWIFLNGIATSHYMLQISCDMLAATFHRNIIGIHNRSYGLIIDILECILQRSFGYETEDIRIVYQFIKKQLHDDKMTKVVVIAHSQGGIVISVVLTQLYATVPAQCFQKLEIYTFGSAAANFYNPVATSSLVEDSKDQETTASPVSDTKVGMTTGSQTVVTRNDDSSDGNSGLIHSQHYIPTIEHFVNSRDLVPRWGVLFHFSHNSYTSYYGKIIIHENQSGHLFDQHYLELMFPLLELDRIRSGNDAKLFLNHCVSDDGRNMGLRAMTFGRNAVEGSGRRIETVRVRDLSRLWRYMAGGMA